MCFNIGSKSKLLLFLLLLSCFSQVFSMQWLMSCCKHKKTQQKEESKTNTEAAEMKKKIEYLNEAQCHERLEALYQLQAQYGAELGIKLWQQMYSIQSNNGCVIS